MEIDLDKEKYISLRVDEQIQWFDKKSSQCQRRFKLLRGIEIISAAAIPVLASFSSNQIPFNLLIAALGALIVIISALLSLNQYQENWTEYRKTSELLKHHKFLFLTQASPYDETNGFSYFAQQIETILAKENLNWANYTQSSLQQTNTAKEKA